MGSITATLPVFHLPYIAFSMFGGMAGCAMIGQSVITVKSGGRFRLSTFTAGVFLMILIIFLGDIVKAIPIAALVGVMIMVSISTFEWHSIKEIKIDFTPSSGEVIDLTKFAELGKKGVKLLMCDSTNAERPGYTLSECIVEEALEKIFNGKKSRILVATFASNINRIQQVVNTAMKFNRKIAICGRSMVNVCTKWLLASLPDIISRGFIYVRESEDFIHEIKHIVKDALENNGSKNWTVKKTLVKDILKDYLYKKTKRKPVILPVIMEV